MGCLPPPGRDRPRGQTRTAAPRRRPRRRRPDEVMRDPPARGTGAGHGVRVTR
jgi:hypothetical protein